MKSRCFHFCLALALGGVLFGCSTAVQHPSAASAEMDANLTKQVSNVLIECQKIKPGMTRAELLKVFTTEGGISNAQHRTYIYGRCPCIKVDVDFNLSNPQQNVLEERLTDTISKISKPYLDWSILD